MLRTEIVELGEMNFRYTHSDAGMQIKQVETGILYDEAYDILEKAYTYEETDVPIDTGEAEDIEV